jgi:hypothetical protein
LQNDYRVLDLKGFSGDVCEERLLLAWKLVEVLYQSFFSPNNIYDYVRSAQCEQQDSNSSDRAIYVPYVTFASQCPDGANKHEDRKAVKNAFQHC